MTSFETERLTECMICGSREIDVVDSDAALWICKSCNYVFDNPRPTLSALVGFYSAPAKYDSWLSEEVARTKLWAKRLRKMRSKSRPGNLLDVGAGIGQFLDLARRNFTEVWGTEVSSSAVAIAKEKYGLELFHGTLDSLCLPAESFDNITAFHVLEHVPNPRMMIEKCYTLLRSAGILVIAVPNDYRPMKARVRMILGRFGFKKYHGVTRSGLPRIRLDGSMSEIHLSHFTPKVLLHLLESCGFSVVRASVDPYFVPNHGLDGFKQSVRYKLGLLVHAIMGVNIYDAIWMVAQKQHSEPEVRMRRRVV